MNKYHIRFNTKHSLDGRGVWRIFENGVEHLVDHLDIRVKTFDEITVENDQSKWNICCYGNMSIVDGVAVIE